MNNSLDQKTLKPDNKKEELEKIKEGVIRLLQQHNIPFENWGQGTAKTLDHLVKEVAEGEAVLEMLESGKLVRKVSITYIDVYYTNPETKKRFKLVEEKQIFKDGRERKRTLEGSLAQKIKAGEIPNKDMINRAIQEELGITGEVPAIPKGTGEISQDSPSFPGLKMHAKHYLFEIELEDSQYNDQGYTEHQIDKDTYFKWTPL